MIIDQTAARFAVNALGTPYTEADCFELVRRAFKTRGIDLPERYYDAAKLFRTLPAGEPLRAWDVVVIRNHPVLVNHVGVMIGERHFVHALETTGTVISSLDDSPWNDPARIAGFMRLNVQKVARR